MSLDWKCSLGWSISAKLVKGTGLILSSLYFSIAAHAGSITPQVFVPDDVIVSDPNGFLRDMEFDPQSGLLSWQNSLTTSLWVATVNPLTGAFTPINGQGTRIDTNLLPLSTTQNGPEWIWGLPSAQIIYSVQTSQDPVQSAIKRAYRTIQGTWVSEVVPNSTGYYGPVGSKNPTDIYGQFNYRNAIDSRWAILNIINPFTPTVSYVNGGATGTSGRWTLGLTNYGFTSQFPNNGYSQVVYFDPVSNSATQLTFDNSDKDDIFMWSAPEYNGDLLLMALVDNTKIQIWRNIGNKDPLKGSFTLLTTIQPPNTRPYMDSPEPFVYKGHSYVFYLRSDNPPLAAKGNADLFFSSVTPDGNGAPTLTRQVSDPAPALRSDPEYFSYNPKNLLYPNGDFPLFLYYSEIKKTGEDVTGIIIHRCLTGL